MPVAAQEKCAKEDFGAAVDSAGAALRKFNLETQPRFNAKLEALRAKKGWQKTATEDKAVDYLQDGRIGELDAQSNELLTKIDALGRVEEGKPVDCSKLAELKAAGVELLAVMKAKSNYTLEKIDLELQGGGGPTAAVKPAPPAAPAPSAAPAPAAPAAPGDVKIISKAPEAKSPEAKAAEAKDVRPKTETKAPEVKPAEPKTKSAEVKPEVRSESTPSAATLPPVKKEAPPKETARAPERGGAPPATVAGRPQGDRLPDVVPSERRPGPPSSSSGSSNWETSSDRQAMLEDQGPPGQPYSPGPGPGSEGYVEEEGYTIEEIRDATRGFFGTISTNLAAVIEHAFSKSGRPTAYILGQEGGGAFLAGLRYGDGTLYMRSGGPQMQKIYWHGPSVGYDFGAEGSRTLFLIYKMHSPSEMYRAFTGIDGSAYVVGGVGLTFLKGGPVTMAPIRTGIGLRIGANLGYVRFTPQQTWNPF